MKWLRVARFDRFRRDLHRFGAKSDGLEGGAKNMGFFDH